MTMFIIGLIIGILITAILCIIKFKVTYYSPIGSLYATAVETHTLPNGAYHTDKDGNPIVCDAHIYDFDEIYNSRSKKYVRLRVRKVTENEFFSDPMVMKRIPLQSQFSFSLDMNPFSDFIRRFRQKDDFSD